MEFDSELMEELASNIREDLGRKLQERLVYVTLKDPQILNRRMPGQGMSLLHYSVGLSDNKAGVVKVLLDHGADPNNTDCEDKVSPLHLSIMYEFDTVMDCLLKHGGDPYVQDGEGKTCYDLVKTLEQPDVFKSILVKHTSFSALSSISSEGSGGASDTMSYMTCFSSCNDDPIQAGGKMSFFTDDEVEEQSVLLDEVVRNRRYGFLSTIREETSSVMNAWNKISHHSQASSNGNKTTTLSLPAQVEEKGDKLPEVQPCRLREEESVEETRETLGLPPAGSNKSEPVEISCGNLTSSSSSSLTHSIASTPSNPPSPTNSEIDRLQTIVQNLNINLAITPTTYHTIAKFVSPTNQLTLTKTEYHYSQELVAAIQDLSIIDRLKFGDLAIQVAQDATKDSPKRNGKSFYNYVLLDPKVIKRINLSGDHLKSDVIKNSEKFRKFISAIFYIGKGCGKRPINHLEDAKVIYMRKNTLGSNDKIKRILNIWKSGQGVLVHSFFHHSSEREANVNEASMIDAMGLKELSNLKKGSYSGETVSKWNQKQKNQFGVFLLRYCFSMYAVSSGSGTNKEIFPHDI